MSDSMLTRAEIAKRIKEEWVQSLGTNWQRAFHEQREDWEREDGIREQSIDPLRARLVQRAWNRRTLSSQDDQHARERAQFIGSVDEHMKDQRGLALSAWRAAWAVVSGHEITESDAAGCDAEFASWWQSPSSAQEDAHPPMIGEPPA